jgi:hypothetical protein
MTDLCLFVTLAASLPIQLFGNEKKGTAFVDNSTCNNFVYRRFMTNRLQDFVQTVGRWDRPDRDVFALAIEFKLYSEIGQERSCYSKIRTLDKVQLCVCDSCNENKLSNPQLYNNYRTLSCSKRKSLSKKTQV